MGDWQLASPASDSLFLHLLSLKEPGLNATADHSASHMSSEIFKARNVNLATDKGLLYVLLQALLSVKQEKEIQMKMIVTRGESVLQNTSPEGIPAIQQQLQSVKDLWASLLSAGIRCKRLVKPRTAARPLLKDPWNTRQQTVPRVHSLPALFPSFLPSLLPSFLPFLFSY